MSLSKFGACRFWALEGCNGWHRPRTFSVIWFRLRRTRSQSIPWMNWRGSGAQGCNPLAPPASASKHFWTSHFSTSGDPEIWCDLSSFPFGSKTGGFNRFPRYISHPKFQRDEVRKASAACTCLLEKKWENWGSNDFIQSFEPELILSWGCFGKKQGTPECVFFRKSRSNFLQRHDQQEMIEMPIFHPHLLEGRTGSRKDVVHRV